MDFWLKIPAIYDLIQLVLTGGFMKPVSESIKQAKNKRILDLGCGTGDLIKFLNPSEYIGLDINQNFIKIAKKKYPDFRFIVADITKVRLPKEKFDYVIIVNVLHHLKDIQVKKLFSNISLVKKKKLIIVESKPRGPLGPILEKLDAGDNFRQTPELSKMIRDHFKTKSEKIVLAPLKTYQYYIAECTI